MALNFKTPISFSFSDTETVNFISVEECQKWAEKERDTWGKLKDAWSSSPLAAKKYRFDFDSQIKPFDGLFNICAQAISKNDADSFSPQIITELGNIKNKLCVRSNTNAGKNIIVLSEKNLLLALTTMCGVNPNFYVGADWITGPVAQTTTGNKERLTSIIQGFANALIIENNPDLSPSNADALKLALHEAGISEKRFSENIEKQNALIEKGEKELEQISNKSIEQQSAIKNIFEGFTASAKIEMEALKSTAKAEIEALKAEISLHEPIKYWADEFDRYKDSATGWAVTFLIFVAITICALIGTMSYVVDKQYLDFKNPNFESVFVFLIVPLFFLVWILKLIAKRYQTNFHLMNDAKNREVMTKAFLSLMAGNHADGKDKILILSALFRPAPDMKYDDGAPVHWFDLVLDKIQESQKKGSS
ncbi:MAG: hypothetical protein K8R48_00890 [Alphaproteobacteria bacterium]|nr:hypothetical protein [Alphaproteobacteria bacterium]